MERTCCTFVPRFEFPCRRSVPLFCLPGDLSTIRKIDPPCNASSSPVEDQCLHSAYQVIFPQYGKQFPRATLTIRIERPCCTFVLRFEFPCRGSVPPGTCPAFASGARRPQQQQQPPSAAHAPSAADIPMSPAEFRKRT